MLIEDDKKIISVATSFLWRHKSHDQSARNISCFFLKYRNLNWWAIYSGFLVDITVVYLQKPIKIFCFKQKRVKDGLKKFDCVLFGFFSSLN